MEKLPYKEETMGLKIGQTLFLYYVTIFHRFNLIKRIAGLSMLDINLPQKAILTNSAGRQRMTL